MEILPLNERCIAVVGLPGAGKSSVGRVLAQMLARDFVDSDAVVEDEMGMSIDAFVRRAGWAAFRARERRVLARALGRAGAVIATGGGAVEAAAVRQRLAQAATVVWLQAPPAVLAARLAADDCVRPLLGDDPAARLGELARRRGPLYAQVADIAIDATRGDASAVAARVRARLAEDAT